MRECGVLAAAKDACPGDMQIVTGGNELFAAFLRGAKDGELENVLVLSENLVARTAEDEPLKVFSRSRSGSDTAGDQQSAQSSERKAPQR